MYMGLLKMFASTFVRLASLSVLKIIEIKPLCLKEL